MSHSETTRRDAACGALARRPWTELRWSVLVPSASLGQWWQHAGLAAIAREDIANFRRHRIERFRGGHFADQRLVEPQSDNIFNRRSLGVAQYLLADLHAGVIGHHPGKFRLRRKLTQ